MRKSQKRQIENILALLDKAQNAVKKALETGNFEIALSLLEQSQDSAIQIGGMIEESFGEDFTTIGMLENYCEEIYQTYELIRQKQPVNVNKTCKNLRKNLIQIENSVRNDIQVRTTAVFLPYKASMWDSLESVWKAADEDPNCDAYVVPIPYFDKNPDGSFREMHYEGDEYPKYIPIISWEEYDIAAEHPDMIFIHNPYDEFNHVTSVHPAYYSKELKNQTDLLVYIPYYILGKIDPDDRKAVDNLEHFCTVPAVVYADKVIVQSKEWQKVYIDVMTRTLGNDTKQVWEKKILGLGSPKMDKVHITEKDDLDIPKEWLKIIEKPDGSWKKIIFYNTSVSALLQYEEKMLEKMQYVFDVFKENRDEAVLLWRPHPLIKATIESMRPQMWMKYEKIVQMYIEEGWGIYDDTADMNRAVAVSDAYYGDPSSIVQLYRETGKLIMMQNVEKIESNVNNCDEESIFEKDRINLHSGTVIRVKDDVYFSEAFFNGLFKINVNNFSVDFIGRFSEERWERDFMHVKNTVQYQDTLVFFPLCSRHIHMYNVTLGEEKCVTIPIPENSEFAMLGSIQVEDKIWIFPGETKKGIFVLDMRNKEIQKDESLSRLLLKYETIVGWCVNLKERKGYTYCPQNSTLIEIDVKNGEVSEYTVLFGNGHINLINYYNDMLYFTDIASGDLYEWNLKNASFKKYIAQELNRVIDTKALFSGCCFMKDDIYMIPYANREVMKINSSGMMEKAFEYPMDFKYLKHWREDYYPGLMIAAEVIEHNIWFYPYGLNRLFIYDTVTGQVESHKLTVNFEKVFPDMQMFSESNLMTLEWFCERIQKSTNKTFFTETSLGEKIYQAIKQ